MSKPSSRPQTRQAQRRDRREEMRRRELDRQTAKRRRNILFISAIAVAALIILFIVLTNFVFKGNPNPNNPTANNGNSLFPVVDNVSCDQFEHSDHHVHAHLTVYMNGQKVDVPQNIGIAPDNSCLYWLHTHDATGVLHVEAPKNQTYTIGSFLRIWREQFTSLQYPNQLSAPNGWKAYVDGKPFEGDFNDIEFASHRLITLAYNSPDITPTTQYNWPANLAQ